MVVTSGKPTLDIDIYGLETMRMGACPGACSPETAFVERSRLIYGVFHSVFEVTSRKVLSDWDCVRSYTEAEDLQFSARKLHMQYTRDS